MNMRSILRCHSATCRTATKFLGEERGSITIFAVLAFVMCLVVVGLAFDFGRVMGIHTEVGAYADRVALSAAAKLNGQEDSLDNAVDKAFYDRNNIPGGRQDGVRMSLTGGSRAEISRLTFSDEAGDTLITWRPGSGFSGSSSDKQFAARNARRVTVETTGAREGFLLFPIGGSGVTEVTVSPIATAGYQMRACNIAPVMVCNPDETVTSKRYDATSGGPAEPYYLRGTRTAPGQSRPWQPRTYSLFETATRDATELHDLISSTDPRTACFGQRVGGEIDLNNSSTTREAVGGGFNDRVQKMITVAVVNCDQYQSQLDLGNRVPVEAYARMEISEPVTFGDPTTDDRVMLRRAGPLGTNPSTHIHEYPVLLK